jgi:hypothetical protein
MQARDIFGLEGLADLGSRNAVDIRPTLLRVLTDLYVHRLSHTAAEERHYTELALRLLEAADVPTRVAVARRLAHYLSPPLRILQWLARDLPEVAAELRLHPLLQPAAPVDAAAPSSAAILTAENDAADEEPLPANGRRALDEATAGELNDFFFTANAEERRLILRNLNVVAPVVSAGIRVLRDPAINQQLEAAALTGKSEDFAHQLARALYIPREQARRIARDDSGEPVVIAAKALGVACDVLYRILMFLNPTVGHSVERVHALAALHEELTAPAAAGMLAIWQALPASERMRAKHRPFAWDDEKRRRARPTTPVQRRSPLLPVKAGTKRA